MVVVVVVVTQAPRLDVRSRHRGPQLLAVLRGLPARLQGPLLAAQRWGSWGQWGPWAPELRGSLALRVPGSQVLGLRVLALRVDRLQVAQRTAARSPAGSAPLVRVALEQRCGPMQTPRQARACDATAPANEVLQRKTSRCRPQNRKHMDVFTEPKRPRPVVLPHAFRSTKCAADCLVVASDSSLQ